MSDIRYYEEQVCEHGELGICRVEWALDKPCPGGSRRETTVDYEAAAIARRNQKEPSRLGGIGWDELQPWVKRAWIEKATAIVDAALGRGDTREERE